MPLEALRECCMLLPGYLNKFSCNLFQQLFFCILYPFYLVCHASGWQREGCVLFPGYTATTVLVSRVTTLWRHMLINFGVFLQHSVKIIWTFQGTLWVRNLGYLNHMILVVISFPPFPLIFPLEHWRFEGQHYHSTCLFSLALARF